MRDLIEVSYTGDLLAHRRCARAWAYEKHVGFHPYEQVQAMEGRLVHHGLEWLATFFQEKKRHATGEEFQAQLERHWKVLYARGVHSAFSSKSETLGRVRENIYPGNKLLGIIQVIVEGAVHTEYELRSVRKILPPMQGKKTKLLLTGILDLVIQQPSTTLTYTRGWAWSNVDDLKGRVVNRTIEARPGDVEIWDHKATRSRSDYLDDYIRQLLTYAALYRERTGEAPTRCVLFFVNEPDPRKKLLALEYDQKPVDAAVTWTHQQVRSLEDTIALFQRNPCALEGGEYDRGGDPLAHRVTEDLKKQCTACGFRFDCPAYNAHLGGKPGSHPDVELTNVGKN